MTEIRSLADLRPGDIMFGPIGGIVPGFFPVGVGQALLGELFRVGELSVRHVGVVVSGIRAPMSFADAPMGPILLGHGTGKAHTYPRLVQAMPRGAEEIELTQEHWTRRYAYARIPEDYVGQAKDAAAIARLFVSEKVPYSFASYAALAVWRFGFRAERLARWVDRRRPAPPTTGVPYEPFRMCLPAEAICSVLADQAWTLTGKDLVQGTRSQIVTPGMLAQTLFRMQGVEWGGAGF